MTRAAAKGGKRPDGDRRAWCSRRPSRPDAEGGAQDLVRPGPEEAGRGTRSPRPRTDSVESDVDEPGGAARRRRRPSTSRESASDDDTPLRWPQPCTRWKMVPSPKLLRSRATPTRCCLPRAQAVRILRPHGPPRSGSPTRGRPSRTGFALSAVAARANEESLDAPAHPVAREPRQPPLRLAGSRCFPAAHLLRRKRILGLGPPAHPPHRLAPSSKINDADPWCAAAKNPSPYTVAGRSVAGVQRQRPAWPNAVPYRPLGTRRCWFSPACPRTSSRTDVRGPPPSTPAPPEFDARYPRRCAAPLPLPASPTPRHRADPLLRTQIVPWPGPLTSRPWLRHVRPHSSAKHDFVALLPPPREGATTIPTAPVSTVELATANLLVRPT
jgi:hypothetical protein